MKKKSIYLPNLVLFGLFVVALISARFDFVYAQTQDSQGAGNLQNAITAVASTTGKAVVSISTERTQRVGRAQGYYFDFPWEDFFGNEEFFRRFFEDFFGGVPEREYKQMGLGSGTIIDPDGYILTNEHVVAGADKITVTVFDGGKFNAELKGKDKRSDLAVIKINANNLPAARLGNSEELRIGEWVVAIGNPFGFALANPEPTVTVGVISALHRYLGRAVLKERNYNDLIQTDAAINPGNSGGPLVNLKGEIVGINVAIFSTSGGYQGIGFAIPINEAKRIISQLISGKKILYGWLGVTVQDLTNELAEHFDLADAKGALVVTVIKNSPAEEAGIKEGDVIKKFGNEEIDGVRRLLSAVSKAEVDKRINVLALRNNKKISLGVKIAQRPESLDLEESPSLVSETWRGMEVEEISPDLARRLRIKQDQGVMIVNIEPNSPADEAGLIPEDIILKINHRSINNLSEYQEIIKDFKGSVLIKTQRGYFVVK